MPIFKTIATKNPEVFVFLGDNIYADPTTYHRENFGDLTIDWDRDDPFLKLQILDVDGVPRIEKSISLSRLKAK